MFEPNAYCCEIGYSCKFYFNLNSYFFFVTFQQYARQRRDGIDDSCYCVDLILIFFLEISVFLPDNSLICWLLNKKMASKWIVPRLSWKQKSQSIHCNRVINIFLGENELLYNEKDQKEKLRFLVINGNEAFSFRVLGRKKASGASQEWFSRSTCYPRSLFFSPCNPSLLRKRKFTRKSLTRRRLRLGHRLSVTR